MNDSASPQSSAAFKDIIKRLSTLSNDDKFTALLNATSCVIGFTSETLEDVNSEVDNFADAIKKLAAENWSRVLQVRAIIDADTETKQ